MVKESKGDNSSLETASSKKKSLSPDCVIVDTNIINEINEDKFTQKQFSSNKSRKVPENIVIDLSKNTIKVPEVEQVELDSIFHHNVSVFFNI